MLGLMVFGAIAIYIWIAIRVTRWITHKALSVRVKRTVKYVCVVVFILIPTWDAIIGRAYFQYLCATEGGVKVYKQVELPAEYWNEDRSPKFILPNGNTDEVLFKSRFKYSSDAKKKLFFNIDRYTDVLKDKRSDETIGEYTTLFYFGGWLINHTGMHVTGTYCPKIMGNKYEGFFRYILIPTVAQKKGEHHD